MSSAASSSRVSSPEPILEQPPVVISKKKKQKKQTDTHGREEGTAKPYQPPPNAVLLDHTSVDYAEFDWDSVNADENCEVWLIRIPDSVKPKYLESLNLELPPTTARSTKVGTLNRKLANYDVWTIGDSNEADGDAELPIVGEEIRNLTCLLPRKSKKGKLYRTPKPITRRLVLAAQPAVPSSDADARGAPVVYQNPPRHSYPKELLKHHFMPFGSELTPVDTVVTEPEVSRMEVDTEVAPAKPSEVIMTSNPPQKTKEKVKGKKRKGDDGEASPKKLKKVKTSA